MEFNIRDQRAVRLEKVYSTEFIPLFQGRPNRSDSISKNDMVDLEIALNTSQSLEELIAKM